MFFHHKANYTIRKLDKCKDEKHAEGPTGDLKYTEGSHHQQASWLDDRSKWLEADGKPMGPDWKS